MVMGYADLYRNYVKFEANPTKQTAVKVLRCEHAAFCKNF